MSSRIPSLLLPLCLAGAVVLNVYPLLDPTGVYGSYLSDLDGKTPPIAAMSERFRHMNFTILIPLRAEVILWRRNHLAAEAGSVFI